MSFTDILAAGLITSGGSTAAYAVGAVLTAAIAYIIGSLNFSVMLSKDAPEENKMQKNIAFVLDAVKGAVCVIIGMILMPADGFAYIAALFCIVGQAFPAFFKFRGMRVAPVYIGAALLLNPAAALISIVAFALVLVFSKYMSLSTMVMALVFPLVNFYIKFSLFSTPEDPDLVAMINYMLRMLVPIAIALAVCLSHISNIKRLISGTEERFGEKK